MWKCPKCETLNDGERCMICGEAKPKTPPKPPADTAGVSHGTAAPAKRYPGVGTGTGTSGGTAGVGRGYVKPAVTPPVKKKRINGAVGCIIGIAVGLIIIIAALEGSYRFSIYEMDNRNYAVSNRIFSLIRFYRDSDELMDENKYREANDLLESGDMQEAKQIFETISDYEDSSDLIQECDYRQTLQYADDGELVLAYELFEQLDGYLDSANQLNIVKETAYQRGIESYRTGYYSEASEYFDLVGDYGDTVKYNRLISAALGTESNVSQLYDLIDFENTKDIILNNNSYLQDYLIGTWKSSSGEYIKYSYESDGYHSTYNIPNTDGSYYRIRDGIHYNGSDDTSWIEQWKFTILSLDKISIYCYKDGKTYILYRQ